MDDAGVNITPHNEESLRRIQLSVYPAVFQDFCIMERTCVMPWKDEPNCRQQVTQSKVLLMTKTENKTHDGAKQEQVANTKLRLR